jgi:hypothetical protein
MLRGPKHSKNEVVAPTEEEEEEEEEEVLTVSGEPSPIRHPGRRAMGDQQLHTSLFVIITTYVHGLQRLTLHV